MNEILEDIVSVPGEVSYLANSEPANSIVSICLVTEGASEEVEYFRYVKDEIAKHPEVALSLAIVNESLSEEETHCSNPKSRYMQLKKWQEENALTEGLVDVHDEAWLVCDRDNGSFSENQYDFLMEKVDTEDLHMVVSNPAFQIWLLFHFEENIDALNLDSMEKSKDRIVAVERELKTYVSDYTHGSLSMNSFKEHIKEAVGNCQNYPQDLTDLKLLSGTNFSTIIQRTMPWLEV